MELSLTPRKKMPAGMCTEQRLAITLKYLATGDNIFSIATKYRIGERTVEEMIKETCKIIYKVLSPTYLRVPSKPVWRNISKGFAHDWQLFNCCGAIDEKHVCIKAPPKSGSVYYNYKNFYSIVLLAASNHRYEFTVVNVGVSGSESDGGIFARSKFGKSLHEGRLDLPEVRVCLPKSNIKVPYYFVADEAFRMSKNLIGPYPGRHLDKTKRIFNYRLSRARRCIENAFGILVSRWQVFSKSIGFHPKEAAYIVLACVCLHNLLMARTQKAVQQMYCPSNFVDQENEIGQTVNGLWRDEITTENISLQHVPSDDVIEAHKIRDTLASYFVTPEGQVPWQYEFVNRGKYNESNEEE